MADIHQLADALRKLEVQGPQAELREQIEKAFTRTSRKCRPESGRWGS